MIDLDIAAHGGREMAAWLRRGENLDGAIARGLGEWAQETLDDQLYGEDKYPAPPPGSTYIRTGRLGRNWGLRRPGKTSVEFFNMAGPARFVIGTGEGQGQARRMAHWWLGRARVAARLSRAYEAIGREIRKELGR